MNYSKPLSVVVLLLPLLILSSPQVSLVNISESSTSPANGVTPVFSTDFENVTRRSPNLLNSGGIQDLFEYGGRGGARMWMEGLDRETPGITCHSGSRCVGMELTDIAESRRNEFNIIIRPSNLEDLIGNELFVSVWLYLPADWRLHSAYDWYELANPFFTGGPTYLPYAALHILQPDITTDVFNLDFDVRDISGTIRTLGQIVNYPLPRGRWFNLEYFVFRHPTEGIVRVWIDGTLLFNVNHLSTEDPSITSWFTTPAKIYYDPSDKFSPYRIWVDDLAIYNILVPVSSSPIAFPWESTILVAIIGVTALAVMNRIPHSAKLSPKTSDDRSREL